MPEPRKEVRLDVLCKDHAKSDKGSTESSLESSLLDTGQVLHKIDWLHQAFCDKLMNLSILENLNDEVKTLRADIADGRKEIDRLVVSVRQIANQRSNGLGSEIHHFERLRSPSSPSIDERGRSGSIQEAGAPRLHGSRYFERRASIEQRRRSYESVHQKQIRSPSEVVVCAPRFHSVTEVIEQTAILSRERSPSEVVADERVSEPQLPENDFASRPPPSTARKTRVSPGRFSVEPHDPPRPSFETLDLPRPSFEKEASPPRSPRLADPHLSSAVAAWSKKAVDHAQNYGKRESETMSEAELPTRDGDNGSSFKRERSRDSISSGQISLKTTNYDCFERLHNTSRRIQLHPDSILRSLWDFAGCFALLFDSVMIPYILAWNPDMEGFLQFGVYFTAIFWTLDIMVTLSTSYYTKDGDLERQFSKIFRQYFRSTFVLDLFICTSDWLGIVLEMGAGTESSDSWSLLRLVKLNRVIRILRVLRVTKLWERLERLNHIFLSNNWQVCGQVLAIFFFILWLNHVLSCIWYAVGVHASTDTGQSWLDAEANSMSQKSMRDASTLYQYTTAYHWSISQLTPGSMQVVPMNSSERVLNIFCLLFGLLFCTSLISRISALMVQLHITNQEQTKVIRQARLFLRQKRISPSVAQRIERQIYAVLTTPRPLTMYDLPVLSQVSKTLKSELRHDIYSPHLLRQRIFMCLDAFQFGGGKVLRGVCDVLESQQLSASEELFPAGVSTRTSYILMHGCLGYMKGCDFVIEERQVLEEENIWIASAAFWTEWTTKGSLEAETLCEVILIDSSQIWPVMTAQHVRLKSFIKHYRKTFIRLLQDRKSDNASDLDEMVDHALVVFSLPLTNKMELCDPLIEHIRQRNWLHWGSGHQTLSKEISEGKCALVHSSDGSIARVAFVIALRLLRPLGEMLVQIGDITEDSFTPTCRLPGMKLTTTAEAPSVAAAQLVRKVREALQGDGEGIGDLELCGVSIETSPSPTYGLLTQYNRNVFQAHQRRVDASTKSPPPIDFDIPSHHENSGMMRSSVATATSFASVNELVQKHMPWLEKHIPNHIVVNTSGTKSVVYAWIYADEFEQLRQLVEPSGGKLSATIPVALRKDFSTARSVATAI